MDYFIDSLGTIGSIVLEAPINDPEGWGGTPELVCLIHSQSGEYRINTDKWGRVSMGYINMEPGEGTVFDDADRIVTGDPVLIATLNRALTGGKFLPIGTKLEPLSAEEVEREFSECDIPRETEFSRADSGWRKI